MYRPPYTQSAAAEQLVDEAPFATLLRVVDGAVCVAFAPLIRDGADLVGHLARSNDFAKDLDGAMVTALFYGPHGYVSPTWYAAPDQQVPTWNYVVAEARGTVQFEPAVDAVRRLVTAYEATWRAEPALEAQLSRAIVGFRMVAPHIEGKAKLSQNRDPQDFHRVLAQLDTIAPALAAWMRRI